MTELLRVIRPIKPAGYPSPFPSKLSLAFGLALTYLLTLAIAFEWPLSEALVSLILMVLCLVSGRAFGSAWGGLTGLVVFSANTLFPAFEPTVSWITFLHPLRVADLVLLPSAGYLGGHLRSPHGMR